jgi:hypothetical protein
MITIARAEKFRTSDLACWHQSAGSPRLVSLWDMLRVHAEDFIMLMKSIDGAARVSGSMPEVSDGAELGPKNTQEVLFIMWNTVWSHTKDLLNKSEPICKNLELDLAISQIARIRERFDDETLHNKLLISRDDFASLKSCMDELCHRIDDQLRSRMFMFVPSNDVKYYTENAALFGEKVHDKFPKLRDDIENAGRCLMVGSADGAIFHLMRVLEPTVKRLGRSVGLSQKIIHGQPWGKILDLFDTAIGKIPAKTPRQQKYSEISAHLRHCKNAWRDPVSHTRKQFTMKEATVTFEHVKAFVSHLAINLR